LHRCYYQPISPRPRKAALTGRLLLMFAGMVFAQRKAGWRAPKLHSTNPVERVNGEIKRRTEVASAGVDRGSPRRHWKHAWHAVLDALHVNEPVCQVDLIPAQRADLGRPEPMAVCDKDHCCVAVSVALARRFAEQLDFLRGQVLAGPPVSI
jgi:hypothetical protein